MGAGATVKGVTLNDNPAKVQLPPLDLQLQFDLRCVDILSLCTQQSAATAKAQATFDALLAQAFG